MSFTTLAVGGDEIAAMAVCGSLGIAIVSIVSSAIRRSYETKAREQSRREIAAYIAEGSMTPEQGVQLMAAGEDKKNRC